MAHHHHHTHEVANYGWAFAIGVSLNLGFVILELVYGTFAHSLALIGDSAHNFSDVFALLLAWGASVLVRRRATRQYTYGWRRTSIMAALINGGMLLIVTGGIAWEALRRFSQPDNVNGPTIMAVAIVGILVNGVTALLFISGRNRDLNIRGAFMHMAADALVSLGVVVTGLVISFTHWLWLDPAVSLAISAVILLGSWGLLREAINLSLDAVPEGIDTVQVQKHLESLPEVISVHDLHIWGMSTTEAALTVHLVMKSSECSDAFLTQVTDSLHDTFAIEHVTIQRETGDPAHPCRHCPSLAAPE